MVMSRSKKRATMLRCEALEDRTAPAVLEPGFTESAYVSAAGISGATGLAWAPDGSNRLYIALKGGSVRVVQNGSLLATPFSTDTVFTSSECGLIGITFDRDYVTNGYVYLFMTISSSQQQIVRYADVDKNNVADVGSRTVIVPNLPTVGANHDGGAIAIGFDNKIYWGIGDLGNLTGVNNNLTSLASKIGRANLNGTVPANNPFNDGAGPNNDYIWARGFRNPFTMTFQETTGQLWVNVVGTSYEQIFKVNAGDHAGWNNFEGNQPLPNFIQPKVVYRTGGTDSRTISTNGISRSGNIVTVNHNPVGASTAFLQPGNKITIAGVSDSSFNGTFNILAVNSATQFTYAQTGPNATSTGGTATTVNLGRAATGGDFLNTTAVPPQYRGNFFFTDYVNGDVIRVGIDANNNVISVDPFITTFDNGFSNVVDAAVGPDGAIYYVSAGGSSAVMRSAYTPTAQGLHVTPTYLAFPEGGKVGFAVRLAQAPAANVDVIVAHAGGSNDLSVFSGGVLTFTPANWATPQAVILAAATDPDAFNDVASFSISAVGFNTETLTYTAIDLDATAPAITSTPITTAVLNTPYTYDVDASGNPDPTYSLLVAPPGMTIDSTTGVISWTPTTAGSFNVTVQAANTVLPNASQSFTIVANTAPTVTSLLINGTIDPTNPNTVQSRLNSITVTFGQPVSIAAGAFTLSGFDPFGSPIAVPTANISVAGNNTNTITLTFTGTTNVNSGSLADGRWTLAIENTLVTATGGGPSMQNDYTSPLLKRLFGDSDGNGIVDGSDFGAFGIAFGGSSFAFDFDNNGTINAVDFGAFGARFGLTV